MRSLCLVAHPDDEVFFAGSLLCSTPRHSWDVICLTCDEHEREEKFNEARMVLSSYGANIVNAEILYQPDPVGPVPDARWFALCLAGVRDAWSSKGYDLVVTHNRKGDYGHPHHIACNAIARTLGTKVWEFTHSRATGVGRQWHGEAYMHVPAHPGKSAALGCYFDELVGFQHHYPELGHDIAVGNETFTGDGNWPA